MWNRGLAAEPTVLCSGAAFACGSRLVLDTHGQRGRRGKVAGAAENGEGQFPWGGLQARNHEHGYRVKDAGVWWGHGRGLCRVGAEGAVASAITSAGLLLSWGYTVWGTQIPWAPFIGGKETMVALREFSLRFWDIWRRFWNKLQLGKDSSDTSRTLLCSAGAQKPCC